MVNKKSISIRLGEEEIKKIKDIAEKEGVKRSFIIKKAITQFIENYGKESQDEKKIYEKISEIERKYGSVLIRTNILKTQVDNIIKRMEKIEKNGKNS